MNVKCRKITSYAWNFQILPVFSQFLWNLTFIFADPHNKFSLLLFQMTNYIFSPLKIQKRIHHSLNFSGTRFFLHSKLKLLNFLADSVLIFFYLCFLWLNKDFRFFGFLQIVWIWITPCMHVSFFVREYFLLCQYGAGPSF